MITVGRWKWSWSSHRFLKWAKFFGAMVDLQMYPICLVKGLPPPFIPLFAMNIFHDFSIFLWNIRVALGCCTKCHCRHLIKSYKPSLLMLYETHVAFSSFFKILDGLVLNRDDFIIYLNKFYYDVRKVNASLLPF